MKSKKNKQENLQENRVIVENGEVKIVYGEKTMKEGYLSLEEAERLLLEMVHKIYATYGKQHNHKSEMF